MADTDILAIMQAMMQAAQQQGQTRLQGQREFLQSQQPQRRGMGGGLIDPVSGREAGNAFDNGFFRQQASDLPAESIARSQGGTAMNQWQYPGKFEWSVPDPRTNAEAAMQASPPMFDISESSKAFLHGGVPLPQTAGPVPSPDRARGNPMQPQPPPQPRRASTPVEPLPKRRRYVPGWNSTLQQSKFRIP